MWGIVTSPVYLLFLNFELGGSLALDTLVMINIVLHSSSKYPSVKEQNLGTKGRFDGDVPQTESVSCHSRYDMVYTYPSLSATNTKHTRFSKNFRKRHKSTDNRAIIHVKVFLLEIRMWKFAVGDLVYVLDTAKTKGRSKKLNPLWKGPRIIAQKIIKFMVVHFCGQLSDNYMFVYL